MSRMVNDDLARTVASHPDRFVGLGTLPMNSPTLATQEMKRAAGKKTLSNIFIYEKIKVIKY